MTKSRFSSLVESLMQTLIGYTIAVMAQRAIFPMYGIIIPIETDLKIAGWFVIVSLARQYVIRRLFNWLDA